MKPTILRTGKEPEFYTDEGCFILELLKFSRR